jgi:hypothetical protein
MPKDELQRIWLCFEVGKLRQDLLLLEQKDSLYIHKLGPGASRNLTRALYAFVTPTLKKEWMKDDAVLAPPSIHELLRFVGNCNEVAFQRKHKENRSDTKRAPRKRIRARSQ